MEVNFVIHDDTISAVATALGDGGIGIIRISGNKAIEIANNIFRGINGKKAEDIKTHQVSYGHIIADGEILDEVILIIMKAPNTYTREDVVEIHCHGGSLTVKHILDLTLRQGARLAEPGEFTKRAFFKWAVRFNTSTSRDGYYQIKNRCFAENGTGAFVRSIC